MGFRKEHGKDPQMSRAFKDCVDFMDRDLKNDLRRKTINNRGGIAPPLLFIVFF